MADMPPYNHVGAIVLLISLGLLASVALPWPSLDVELWAGSFTLSGGTLLGVLLCGLACAGAELLVTAHPKLQPQQSRHTFWHWILPAALTAAVWAWLARPHLWETRLLGTMFAGALLALLLYAEYYTADLAARGRPAVQFVLRLSAYPLATLLYLSIHSQVATQWWALVAVAATSAVIGLRLLPDDETHLRRTWPYALCVGVLLALLSRLLGLWVSSPLHYASLLAICLYVLTNLAGQFIKGKLTRWVALEYPLVGLLAALILLYYLH